jgi:hypothetical protein
VQLLDVAANDCGSLVSPQEFATYLDPAGLDDAVAIDELNEFAIREMLQQRGEAIKYVSLWLQSRSHHLGFGRDDAALSIAFLLSVAVFREALFRIGLTSNLQGLFPFAAIVLRN